MSDPNDSGDGQPENLQPPPAFGPQGNNSAGSGVPEMSLEALQYMEGQRRIAEQNAIYVQVYCAALTGLLSHASLSMQQASQMAHSHAGAAMSFFANGQVPQAAPSPAAPQQAIVPQRTGGQAQSNPYQNPYQQQRPQQQPQPGVQRTYQNPYGGTSRSPVVSQQGGNPGQGHLQQFTPPGHTPGPTGVIPTSMGDFNYSVSYGPPPQLPQGPPPGYGGYNR